MRREVSLWLQQAEKDFPDFLRSRDADASGALPAEVYIRVIAHERQRLAEGVLEWIRLQIEP